jgi:zinc transport system substrate-binding protein
MKNYQSPFIFFIKHLIIISLILSLQNAHADEKKNVVVTIKPLEGLVLAIAKNTVNIERLLPDYTSLHHYHFRPSDIRKIKKAALIFRIDEDMERFLSPLLATLQQSKVISLADNPHIQHLPITSSTKNTNDSHDEHDHQHGNQDLHIWMSPHNGIIMAKSITHELSQLNPQYQLIYQQNLAQLTLDIKQFSKKFQIEAKPLQQTPYLVFHDAWHHFSHSFQLNKLASINLHADIQPGVKTIIKTRKKIQQSHASCLFSQPLFRPKTVDTLTEGFDIKTVELDVLGSHLKITPDLYLNLLRYTAQQIKHCL